MDTGAINHRPLVIDYRDSRSNHTTAIMARFRRLTPTPFMALSRITLRCIAVKTWAAADRILLFTGSDVMIAGVLRCGRYDGSARV